MLSVLWLSLVLDAAGDAETLREPEQVTVGIGDQFLGQLSAKGDLLYFVSNRKTTNEIYVQDLDEGRTERLFDEGADATWPRVSPDGRQLLYISFRDNASGLLCVRDLPAGGGRRCLDAVAGAVQAEWLGADRIVLVARTSLDGDLRVVEVAASGRLRHQPMFERNLTGISLSPDGRWLVYVPTERYVERVGVAFAARAARRLEAVRLGGTGQPVAFELNLPGISGQPAFSRDGRWLYVTQFFVDSNRDGVIDAADHGVLFRVAFDSSRDDAPKQAAMAEPLQLTESSWNCQYPTPTPQKLLASCTRRKGGLEVYELPLDGEVPTSFDVARIKDEIDLADKLSQKRLLYRHLSYKEKDETDRRLAMLWLIMQHIANDEFDAAEHWVDRVHKLPDPDTNGIAPPLKILIAQRRAESERERGRLSADFNERAKERMQALAPVPTDSRPAVALKHLVRSEVAAILGDKGEAKRALEAADIDAMPMPAFLKIFADRADDVYRQLDDRDGLVTALRRLALYEKLPPDDRLGYARAMVRALVRGRSVPEARTVLERERAGVAEDSELAFAITLGAELLKVRGPDTPRATIDALLALYRKQGRLDRKRAVMLDGIGQANDQGADVLIEELAQLYVEDTPEGSQEDRRAKKLYRRAMLGRAYRLVDEGKLDEARRVFDNVVGYTRYFEAVFASIDLRLGVGDSPKAIAASYERLTGTMAGPIRKLVNAYLIAVRELPFVAGAEHDAAVKRALSELKSEWDDLKHERMAQAIYGAVRHEEYLEHGDLATAEKANTRYLAALSLIIQGWNPRYKAMIYGQIGMLQAQVGNHYIALDYFDQREKLPYCGDDVSLAVLLQKAKTLLHVGREADAANDADKALAMVEQEQKTLGEFHVLALDRAALYSLAADRYERSLALYDRALPMMEARSPGPERERNLFVTRLSRAAAALGASKPQRALSDLTEVASRLAEPSFGATLGWRYATRDEMLHAYRVTHAGLLAEAHRQLGDVTQMTNALVSRQGLLSERFTLSDNDDDLRALVLAEAQLAEVARERETPADAARWIEGAYLHSVELQKRTGAPIMKEHLDVLWLAAAIAAPARLKLSFDLAGELQAQRTRMLATGERSWREHIRLFETYAPLVSP